MEKDSHTDQQIRKILSTSKTVAVVGISANPEKTSTWNKISVPHLER